MFCIIKSLEHLKNLKMWSVIRIGRKLTVHVIKSQIHLVRVPLTHSQSQMGPLRPLREATEG
jgi:hypothetical protein